MHGLIASSVEIWVFQTGGPWQEAGEDGQDSEHLLPRVGVCRKAGLRIFRLEEIYRCNLCMEMCVWAEAGEAGVSVGGMRGLSAWVSILRELMGRSDEVSGRERGPSGSPWSRRSTWSRGGR